MHILTQNLERIGLPAIAYMHIQVKELTLASIGLPIAKMSVVFFQWVQGNGGGGVFCKNGADGIWSISEDVQGNQSRLKLKVILKVIFSLFRCVF